MIFLSPVGGLANKMRVLNAGVGLSMATQRRLVILCPRDSLFNCKLEELFVFQGILSPRMVQFDISPHIDRKLFKGIDRGLSRILETLDQAAINELSGHPERIRTLASKRSIYIKTCSSFYLNPAPYAQFAPVNSLLDMIEEVAGQFAGHTVGVHIRRRDNWRSIQHSPTEAFIRAMNACLEDDSETKFFWRRILRKKKPF